LEIKLHAAVVGGNIAWKNGGVRCKGGGTNISSQRDGGAGAVWGNEKRRGVDWKTIPKASVMFVGKSAAVVPLLVLFTPCIEGK
jgi:hypothetical protein